MHSPSVSYRLDPETSAFVIQDYNRARPFSNFLPGIAGLWAVPLWAYYVGRGQGVCSAGVRDNDGQILEFQSFNLACMRVEREGFRTFFNVDGGEVYEPFRKGAGPDVEQTMTVSMAELAFKERNEALGIEVEVAYAGLCNRPYAGHLEHQVNLWRLAETNMV